MPENKLLEVGDVIIPYVGMQVRTLVPRKYAYNNSLSDELVKTDIKIGIHEQQSGFGKLEKLVEDLNRTIKYYTSNIVDKTKFVNFLITELKLHNSKPFMIPSNIKYVVTEIKKEPSYEDYCQEYTVVAKALKEDAYDPEGREISFLQAKICDTFGGHINFYEYIWSTKKMTLGFV